MLAHKETLKNCLMDEFSYSNNILKLCNEERLLNEVKIMQVSI